MKIWIVDAFTSRPHSGNPAAVVIVDDFFEDTVLQKIAEEMNLSETAFVKRLGKNHFHIRWFTPKVEVKLCGHATLASVHVLYQENLIEGPELFFDSLSGKLRAEITSSGYMLDFPLKKTTAYSDEVSIRNIFGDAIDIVQAGDDVIVEVTNHVVQSYIPDIAAIEKIDCRGIILTAKGSGPYDFISRFFAPRVGVYEDPVTGSSHCALAEYWHKKLGKKEFFAYQASLRGGEIGVALDGDRVYLTGNAVTMVKGEWQQRFFYGLKNSSQRVQEILNKNNLQIKVVEFQEGTRTSQDAADAVGCDLGQIAKTLLFRGKNSGSPICIIASGRNRVDEKKIEQYIGEEIEKADAAYVVKHTGFAIGGVPAVGYDLGRVPLMDEELMQYATIWSAAGTPHSVFEISPEDLCKITKANIVSIKK